MMVRKPVLLLDNPLPQNLPYPITPTSPSEPLARSSEHESSINLPISSAVKGTSDKGLDPAQDENVWASEAGVSDDMRLHPVLKAGRPKWDSNRTKDNTLPQSLQAGSAEVTPRTSSESQRSQGNSCTTASRSRQTSEPAHQSQHPPSKNPYRRDNDQKEWTSESLLGEGESSAELWGNGTTKSSVSQVAQSEQTQSAGLIEGTRHITVPAASQAPFNEPWMQFDPPSDQAMSASDKGGQPSPEPFTGAAEAADSSKNAPDATDWAQNDQASNPDSLNESSVMNSISKGASEFSDSAPSQPPRPPQVGNIDAAVDSAFKETQIDPSTVSSNRSKPVGTKETYQVRLINWHDIFSHINPRQSPIMVQNANGPCPLLALVNALVLSTPTSIKTVLVETLRVREQISLGLLLDAVIDELMSGRRGDAAQNLPDVSDLYAFLINLHTGMNVNPCFVALEAEAVNGLDARNDLPSTSHNLRKPGGFEVTREMRLYSTFAIPLIHGWIPPRNHPAFAALKRTASTYEDAQNIMFREEELEDKLQRQGLSPDEQVMLEDIASVKYFLSSTATQLTGYGLDTITETQAPGSIAILFRNDHFSTLYRHPRSGQLLTLVTDMGYAGHDEVVWESLADVSGEGCEFYAGDFRPVGKVTSDDPKQQNVSQTENEDGWTTVSGKTPRGSQAMGAKGHESSWSTSNYPPLETLNLNSNSPPMSPNTEQEDHDLALAMQLQEEEEERERREAAARRREDELSQEYLKNTDNQGRRSGPRVPPRGGSGTGQTNNRQEPRRKSSSEGAPPPSYEQAAKSPVYQPPSNRQVSSPTAGPQRPLPPRPRQQSAYSEYAATVGGSPTNAVPPRRGRGHRGRGSSSGGMGGLEGAPGMARRSDAPSGLGPEDDRKDKDCIVM